ncbi:MAG: hypothetical protein ACRERE_31930 [Candidatus Entotheonellia bacterium]
MKTESHELPELYNLWLTVKEFPCQNFVFKNARLLLHRPDTEEKVCQYDFAALIRDYDPTDSWTDYPKQFIAYDLFTRDEKAAIEAYLATHHFRGLSFNAARQTFPIPNHWAPCNAAGYGSWEGEYMFDEEEGFDCPVKFWGYYWLGDTPVVAGLAQITCESDGTIIVDGLDNPSTLTAQQATMLCKTWMRAKALGKTERLSLRYELPVSGHASQRLAHSLAADRMF